MKFLESSTEDLGEIFRLYDEATKFQKAVSDRAWLPFEREFIAAEIAEKRHWKILVDDQIACVLSISFDDALIWREKSDARALYLHRVAVNPAFRNIKFFPKIVEWLREYAKNLDKKFVRMDTWSDNQKLIDYYTSCGFDFLGVTTLTKTTGLPKHYEGISLGLFELKII